MRVEIIEGEGTVLGVNVGHPVVTSGDFPMRGGVAALLKLVWDFLFSYCRF